MIGAGAVAQLGERCVRNAEVEGSTPFRSILEIIVVSRIAAMLVFGNLFMKSSCSRLL